MKRISPSKLKIFEESEFGKKLASVISEEDTLSLVNSFCELYQNMPYANKQDIMEAVLQDKVASLQEFGQLMMQRREQDVTEHYYCPLSAMVYAPCNVHFFCFVKYFFCKKTKKIETSFFENLDLFLT